MAVPLHSVPDGNTAPQPIFAGLVRRIDLTQKVRSDWHLKEPCWTDGNDAKADSRAIRMIHCGWGVDARCPRKALQADIAHRCFYGFGRARRAFGEASPQHQAGP